MASDMSLENPVVVNQVRDSTQPKHKKGQRQMKFKLFMSPASKDKHHKMYDELVNYAKSCEMPSTRAKLYHLTVQDGTAADVMQSIKQCKSAHDLKPLRWLVCKAEVKDCTLALSVALGRSPAEISKHVKTTIQFVDELGRVEINGDAAKSVTPTV